MLRKLTTLAALLAAIAALTGCGRTYYWAHVTGDFIISSEPISPPPIVATPIERITVHVAPGQN